VCAYSTQGPAPRRVRCFEGALIFAERVGVQGVLLATRDGPAAAAWRDWCRCLQGGGRWAAVSGHGQDHGAEEGADEGTYAERPALALRRSLELARDGWWWWRLWESRGLDELRAGLEEEQRGSQRQAAPEMERKRREAGLGRGGWTESVCLVRACACSRACNSVAQTRWRAPQWGDRGRGVWMRVCGQRRLYGGAVDEGKRMRV
jgi:hypothetical protein